MKQSSLRTSWVLNPKSLWLGAVLTAVMTVHASAQTVARSTNNPFSPSPARRVKPELQAQAPSQTVPADVSFIMQSARNARPRQEEKPTIAQASFKIEKTEPVVLPPTEIYKIGAGDVLYISIKNVSNSSGYYTARADGTIDFPLAGGDVMVAGQTVDDVQGVLRSAIKIFPDAGIEVKVREYASHKITVSGMADHLGETSLQREAMPLFAIRAQAVVDSRATKVLIARTTDQNRETYYLNDPKTDEILVYPGNTVEFTSDFGNLRLSGAMYYFVAGEVVSPGQRELLAGLTLYQAVTAAGGVKGDPKKAIIRRKNRSEVLVSFEHNIRSIKDGKSPDPALLPGDVVEVKK